MKKVLLIEDEAGIANAFKKQLEIIAKYDVVWQPDAREALNLLKSTKFDVVLLDLVMPEYDGISFLQDLTDSSGGKLPVPVIVLTNVTSEEIVSQVQKYGVNKYVVKTDISPDELIQIIEESTKVN